MGLDMNFYLRKTELRLHTEDKTFCPETLRIKFPAELGCLKENADGEFDHIITEYCVAYFRKFYPLHTFIINALCDGIDECQYVNIPAKDIDNIVDALQQALDNNSNIEDNDIEPKYKDDFADDYDGDDFDGYTKQYPEEVHAAVDFFKTVKDAMLNSKEVYELYYRASW